MFKQTPKKRVLFVRRFTPVLLALFGVFSLVITNLHSTPLAYATASNTVNFQARLQTNAGAIVPDGDYNVAFKLYDDPTAGGSAGDTTCSGDAHCLWVESYTGGNQVEVINGYLSVNLGSITAFPSTMDWSQQMYLTMNIGGTGSAVWDGEMDPRLKLTAVPYAFLAARASKADQLSTTSGANTSTLSIQAPTGGSQTFDIQDQGAGGTYHLLTQNTGDTRYIQNQNSSAQSTSNFWVSGTGRADSGLIAPSLQTAAGAGATGSITISSGNSSGNTAGNVTIDTGTTSTGTPTVNIGNTNAKAIQIGNNTSNPGVTIDSGTGTIAIGTGAQARTITIGTGAAAQTVTIGSTNTTSSTTINGGTGNITLNTNSSSASIIAKSSTNSATAFEIQNASSAPVFQIDTTLASLIPNGSFEATTPGASPSGWSTRGNATIAASTAQKVYGYNSMLITETGGATGVAKFPIVLSNVGDPTYNVAFDVYNTVDMSSFSYGYAVDGSTETLCSSNVNVGPNTWTHMTCSFTISHLTTVSGSAYFFIGETGTSSRLLYIDGLEMEQTSSGVSYHEGNISVAGQFINPVYIGLQADVTDAFRVRSAAGGVAFNIDSLNGRVGIGTGSATGDLSFNEGSSARIINVLTRTSNAAGTGLTLKAGSGGSGGANAGGDLTLQGGAGGGSGSGGNVYLIGGAKGSSGNGGSVIVKPQSGNDSTSAFQVQNAAGSSLLTVGTSNNTIQLLGNVPATLGTWQTTTALPSSAGNYTAGVLGQATVESNGYIYIIGGTDGTTYFNKTYYAKINGDGTVGSWTAGTTLPSGANSYRGMATIANGYVYYIGGYDGSNTLGNVSYARINSDGSLSTWKSASALTGGVLRSSSAVAYANGYIYIIGGYDASAATRSVLYAKVNADGSVGTWTNVSTALGTATYRPTAVVANGYLYVMGGQTTSAYTTGTQTYYYSALNASTGAPGSFTAVTSSLPVDDTLASSVVSNGYVYILGGTLDGTSASNTVYYAAIPAGGGALGSWTDATSSNSTLAARSDASAVAYNGYIYQIAGNSSVMTTASGQNAVYYTSTGRVQVGGSLDLVGLQNASSGGSGDTSTGAMGGSLTAANGNFIGSLQVQGQASFSQSLAIGGNFSVDSMFAVDISNEKVTIGPAGGDSTGALLVLGNRTAAGDPSTEVDGAMYYNSSMGGFRCGVSGTWQSCIGGLLKVNNTTTDAADTLNASSSAEQTFATNYNMPANYCVPGRVIRMTAQGVWGTGTATQMTFKVKAGSTILASTGTQGTNTGLSGQEWRLDFQMVCNEAPGTGQDTENQGELTLWTAANSSFGWNLLNTSVVTLNTNAAQTLQLSTQFNTSSTSNTMTLRQFVVEGLGP